MPFRSFPGERGEKIRRGVALPYPVRAERGGAFLGGFEVVVDLPFRIDQCAAALAEKVSGMEGRHDGDAMEIDPVTAGADDAGFAAEEKAERDFAKTDDDGRMRECDFL